MRFGGHETFPVRETWLSKGLLLLASDSRAFDDPFVADMLGVGSNMAKSIRHWLRLTGLIEPADGGGFALTALGRLVLKCDKAMLRVGTWWALHVNVCSQGNESLAWYWIFSRFTGDQRFDRIQCMDALTRHLAAEGQRMPSARTLGADVACLLATYARPVPPPQEDPEEVIDSPFRQLGLMVHYRETDTYRIERGPKPVPAEILCYSIATTFLPERASGDGFDVQMREAVARPGGPGRVLALSSDAFVVALADAEKRLGPDAVRSEMVGGDRMIRFKAVKPLEWLADYYARIA